MTDSTHNGSAGSADGAAAATASLDASEAGDTRAAIRAMGLQISDLQAQFETVLPHLVIALKRDSAFTDLHDRLKKAEELAGAWATAPAAMSTMAILHRVRRMSRDGVSLVSIEHELGDALRRQGYIEFDPLGEQFDPTRHIALSGESNDDGSMEVCEVFTTGFLVGEVVVLRAQVRVGPAAE